MIRIAERVARLKILQSDTCTDIAGVNLRDVFTLVGVHLHKAAHALRLAGTRIQYRVAGLQRTRVDTNKRQFAERIIDQLEDQCRKRLTVLRLSNQLVIRIRRIDTLHRRLVQRAGEIIDHSIEQRLHTLVLECTSADYREDLEIDSRLANTLLQLFDRRRLALEELLKQNIVRLGDDLDQLHPESFRLLLQVGWNRLDRVFCTHGLVVPQDRLHLDEVDDALKIGFGADRNLQRNRARTQALADRVDHMLKIRAVLVHLIYKADARNLVLVALPPHGLGLGLHAAHRIK